uniref:Cytochrome c oxidase subunit 3 n=1 Tax=Atractolytocestus huronensis TaxID=507542 RepID=A0A343ESS7_9CEST|nr:cytochrome c oxidase subunit 3 [Atractolytocestus huronensis]ASL24613.1 cytochrome c oxidase subunit 3 [Atractolytocestus huronensis]
MSVVSVLWAVTTPMLIVGLFFWVGGLVVLFVVFAGLALMLLVSDAFVNQCHYCWAFTLFILSEVFLFFSFLHGSSWFYSGDWVSVSDAIELPLVGCFLLLGSSISITAFHHVMSWHRSQILLCATAVLEAVFLLLQFVEFSGAPPSSFFNGFYSSCLATVGLHFSHVLVGVFLMVLALILGVHRVGSYFCTVLTWYWHFVDYIWLLVYALIYVC